MKTFLMALAGLVTYTVAQDVAEDPPMEVEEFDVTPEEDDMFMNDI